MTVTPPPITSRANWGANPLNTPADGIPIPTPELWLHHTGGQQFGAAGMRGLQQYAKNNGYVDLEYTFVIDHRSTEIFMSRGPGRNTAATGGHNTVSSAIAVMGNFMTDQPTDQLLDTIAHLVAYGYQERWWAYPRLTGGHRDAPGNSTACPGNNLEAKLGEINARAAHYLEPTPPKPKPPEIRVKPQYDPPVPIVSIYRRDENPNAGSWGATPDFGVRTFAGSFHGSMAGNSNVAGRTCALIVKAGSPVAGANPPLKTYPDTAVYELIATSGERYLPPPP